MQRMIPESAEKSLAQPILRAPRATQGVIMAPLFVFLILALNTAISIWNAYATGKAWVETKHAGGWPRFMAWMGAIMAASGLSWVILFLLLLGAVSLGKLPAQWAEVGMDLGYILLMPGILFSGLMIAVDSWARAYRTRKVLDLGMAAYNTFAESYNTYHAIQGMGPAFRKVFDAFFGGKDKKNGAMIVLFLVVVALGGGALITAAIIHHVAASDDLPSYQAAAQQA